ncbi:hypothetical protein SAMN05660479_00651 [Microbulbifer thermotolerans]|nr:hypothetical protein SAMN05660479_00651 [Microbulbifer thermotolerans]
MRREPGQTGLLLFHASPIQPSHLRRLTGVVPTDCMPYRLKSTAITLYTGNLCIFEEAAAARRNAYAYKLITVH